MTLRHKDGCNVRGYKAGQIPSIWGRVAPLIQKALNRGSNYTLSDILDGLLQKEMQLWVWQGGRTVHAALVTKIENRDDKRWCLFLAIGGHRMEEWISYLPYIEQWAREQGCQEMRIYGRIGWAKRTGYAIDYARMSKAL